MLVQKTMLLEMHWGWSGGEHSQRAFGVKMTSYQRRCDVITSHRRLYDVIFAPNAHWVTFVFLKPCSSI